MLFTQLLPHYHQGAAQHVLANAITAVVSTTAASLARLDALAVNACCTWFHLFARRLEHPNGTHESIIDPSQRAIVTPSSEVIINRALGKKKVEELPAEGEVEELTPPKNGTGDSGVSAKEAGHRIRWNPVYARQS